MAAMLPLSPNPPTITTFPSLHSTFKGNMRNLKPNPFHIIHIRTKQQEVQTQKGTRWSVVVNQAAKTQMSDTGSNVRFRLDNQAAKNLARADEYFAKKRAAAAASSASRFMFFCSSI